MDVCRSSPFSFDLSYCIVELLRETNSTGVWCFKHFSQCQLELYCGIFGMRTEMLLIARKTRLIHANIATSPLHIGLQGCSRSGDMMMVTPLAIPHVVNLGLAKPAQCMKNCQEKDSRVFFCTLPRGTAENSHKLRQWSWRSFNSQQTTIMPKNQILQ